MPKLSIIIPTYNSAATIERCLASIRVQTFGGYEVLVQDGGSTDGTMELAEEFRRQNPEVSFELKREPDRGVYDAMNKAILVAKGDWLLFLGSDDELYDQNVLSKVMGSREARKCDVLYGNVQMAGEVNGIQDGTIYDGPFDLRKLLKKNICHQAIFYRSAFVAKIGWYNPEYIVCADWDFNMRCWAKGRVKYVDVIVTKFYAGGLSGNFRPDPRFDADVAANIARYFGKRAERAMRPPLTPRRVAGAIARRLRIIR